MSSDVGTEVPFKLHVPDADLELLKKKLELVRFPDELDGAGWDWGVPATDLKRLVVRWSAGFDWRAMEEKINQLPMFTRDVPVEGFGTLNIHYVHQKSACKGAVPLLFTHGWPGQFLEVRKVLPLLTCASSPEQPNFHVVAISLPGFGFSEGPHKTGFVSRQYAEVAHKLMISLGYDQYVVQGGDWGHCVSGYLATYYAPTYVKGWHSNYPYAYPPKFWTSPLLYLKDWLIPYTKAEKAALAKTATFRAQGSGYSHQQTTRPHTLGPSLADSPVGLLAWIYEKLVAWSDSYPWEDDEVLEWVSIYWFSRAGPAASVRIYREMTYGYTETVLEKMKWTPIPVGFSKFPKEIETVPGTWLRTLGKVVFESEHGHGGHFAAHEEPEELVKDIRAMFGKGGPAFGVVAGKSGYE